MMKANTKKGIIAGCDVLLYIITFLVVQVMVVAVCNALLPKDNTTAFIIGQTASALLIIGLFFALRWARIGLKGFSDKPLTLLLWIGFFTLCTLVPSTMAIETAGIDMPKEYEEIFEKILSTPLGYFCVSVIVPIAEEVVFRGGILRRLLQWFGKERRWVAIATSALLFALFHGNLAQGIHAFTIGLFLGWLFYRTNSIVPGVVFHLVNNTTAVVLSLTLGIDQDATLLEMFGGNATLLYATLAASIALGIPAFYKIIKSL